MLGAADSKLFSVIGSFVGVTVVLKIMFVSLVTGAVLAFGKMILRRNFRERFIKLFRYTLTCLQNKRIEVYYDREKEGEDGIIPFTVAITLAVILCVY